MSVDLRKIKKLIELVEESGITELEVRDGEETIRIARSPGQGREPMVGPGTARTGASSEAAPVQRSAEQRARAGGTRARHGRQRSTSARRWPVLFIGHPHPGSVPFVEPGQRVAAGDVLCIIESMKMMNEITADRPGVCVAVVARDGEAVGSGQVLLRFES